jgi:hypothetical protein
MPPVPVILLIPRIQPAEVHVFAMVVPEPNPVSLLLMIVPFVIHVAPPVVISPDLIPLIPLPVISLIPIALVLISLVRAPLVRAPLVLAPLVHISLVRIPAVLRYCRRRHTQPRCENYPRQRSVKETFHSDSSFTT